MIPFDFRKPDYIAVMDWRCERLSRIRQNPGCLPALRAYYRDHPADFISDWGCTSDPRNIDVGLPANIPFILFPKQREWCEWVIDRWKSREPGLTEKSRDMGMSWLSMALSCTLCLFNPSMAIGFGSRKEEYIDLIGSPKCLFEKARMFLSLLPREFIGSWERARHAPHKRIIFPDTGSTITGESGDGIGRGDRASIYFVDEAAFIEHPQLVDASLSATTNCRQDISTPNGLANPFAVKRFSGHTKIFSFHWRDDPRKDDAWYEKQCRMLPEIVVAQEIDCDYSASVEGVLIPSAWVQTAVDSHVKLGYAPSGIRRGALDVADEGTDLNAFGARHGVILTHMETWSGKGSDIFSSVQKAFFLCDMLGLPGYDYDADGLGAGVRGDARVINDKRSANRATPMLDIRAYRGSAKVVKPSGQMVQGRKNEDFFKNLKAQAWWALRIRFQNTYRAVKEGMIVPESDIISIDSKLPKLTELTQELSQPTYAIDNQGKVQVDKKPDGTKSPNMADVVNMLFAYTLNPPLKISSDLLRKA